MIGVVIVVISIVGVMSIIAVVVVGSVKMIVIVTVIIVVAAVAEVRYVKLVRKKDEREALRGHQCTEFSAYHDALVRQGIVIEENLGEMLQRCSRHRARWSPPRTPEGYWDLTVRTPEK